MTASKKLTSLLRRQRRSSAGLDVDAPTLADVDFSMDFCGTSCSVRVGDSLGAAWGAAGADIAAFSSDALERSPARVLGASPYRLTRVSQISSSAPGSLAQIGTLCLK